MQSISLADELSARARAGPGAAGDEVLCPGVPGPARRTSRPARCAPSAARTGWQAPAAAPDDPQADPARGGAGGGSADAAAALRLARARLRARATRRCCSSWRRRSAPTCRAQVCARALAGHRRRGAAAGACPRPRASCRCCWCPSRRGSSTAEVYAGGGPARRAARRRAELAQGYGERSTHRSRWGAAAEPTTRAARQRPAAGRRLAVPGDRSDALAAVARGRRTARRFVSGSGPTVVGLFAGAGAQPGRSSGPRGRSGSRGVPQAIACAPGRRRAGGGAREPLEEEHRPRGREARAERTADGAVRHNLARQDRMSRSTDQRLVRAAARISRALPVRRPTSWSRLDVLLARCGSALAATVLSLYVLAVLDRRWGGRRARGRLLLGLTRACPTWRRSTRSPRRSSRARACPEVVRAAARALEASLAVTDALGRDAGRRGPLAGRGAHAAVPGRGREQRAAAGRRHASWGRCTCAPRASPARRCGGCC